MNSNSSQTKNVGFPAHFMNSGAGASIPVNPPAYHQLQLPPQQQQQHHHLLSQTHGGLHFQLSEPQVQALAQSHLVSAQAHAQAQVVQAQAQAAQAKFQAQLASTTTSPGPAKRPATRPPSRAPPSSSSSPFKTMELAPAGPRRKKRDGLDSRLPEKVASMLPESALYTQLLEYEARLDAAVVRQKVDIQDSFKVSPRVQKTLRIYVFNTFEPAQTGLFSWSLRIVGRLLEDGKECAMGGVKFSSFFKKVAVYLDQRLYPDDHAILWESSRSSGIHEGFEVKRTGDEEFTASIKLEMNFSPEKFKLSSVLSEALGFEVESRARVVAAIWHYVKVRNLQVPSDPTMFVCDTPLRRVFGEERLKFTAVPMKLSQHLSPPQPIHLEHLVKLSGASPAGTSCYDVLVDVPIQLDGEMSKFLVNSDKNKEIDTCDELISASIKKIQEHRRRRAFFLSFSQSPAEFINTLISSQSRDLKLTAGDSGRNADKERRSDFYNQPWAEDAVIRYLNRKSTGSDAPGSA